MCIFSQPSAQTQTAASYRKVLNSYWPFTVSDNYLKYKCQEWELFSLHESWSHNFSAGSVGFQNKSQVPPRRPHMSNLKWSRIFEPGRRTKAVLSFQKQFCFNVAQCLSVGSLIHRVVVVFLVFSLFFLNAVHHPSSPNLGHHHVFVLTWTLIGISALFTAAMLTLQADLVLTGCG